MSSSPLYHHISPSPSPSLSPPLPIPRAPLASCWPCHPSCSRARTCLIFVRWHRQPYIRKKNATKTIHLYTIRSNLPRLPHHVAVRHAFIHSFIHSYIDSCVHVYGRVRCVCDKRRTILLFLPRLVRHASHLPTSTSPTSTSPTQTLSRSLALSVCVCISSLLAWHNMAAPTKPDSNERQLCVQSLLDELVQMRNGSKSDSDMALVSGVEQKVYDKAISKVPYSQGNAVCSTHQLTHARTPTRVASTIRCVARSRMTTFIRSPRACSRSVESGRTNSSSNNSNNNSNNNNHNRRSSSSSLELYLWRLHNLSQLMFSLLRYNNNSSNSSSSSNNSNSNSSNNNNSSNSNNNRHNNSNNSSSNNSSNSSSSNSSNSNSSFNSSKHEVFRVRQHKLLQPRLSEHQVCEHLPVRSPSLQVRYLTCTYAASSGLDQIALGTLGQGLARQAANAIHTPLDGVCCRLGTATRRPWIAAWTVLIHGAATTASAAAAATAASAATTASTTTTAAAAGSGRYDPTNDTTAAATATTATAAATAAATVSAATTATPAAAATTANATVRRIDSCTVSTSSRSRSNAVARCYCYTTGRPSTTSRIGATAATAYPTTTATTATTTSAATAASAATVTTTATGRLWRRSTDHHRFVSSE